MAGPIVLIKIFFSIVDEVYAVICGRYQDTQGLTECTAPSSERLRDEILRGVVKRAGSIFGAPFASKLLISRRETCYSSIRIGH